MINTTNPNLDSVTPLPELIEMMQKGMDYRRTFDTELYGQPVTLVLKPVANEIYLPAMGALVEESDLDEKAAQDLARESADEAVEGTLDINGLPDGFVEFMKTLCRHGIDYEAMGGDAEMLESVFGADAQTFGDFVMVVGNEIAEVTDSLDDAESFR